MSSSLLTRGGNPPAATETPMDPRLRARRVEVARDVGRRRRYRILALLAITVLVVGGIVLARSAVFDVDQVRVVGLTRSDTRLVAETTGIPTGRAMVSVDPGPAEKRLEQLPWVANAVVTRQWPGTVEVRLTERRPVAIAGDGPGAVLVDRDGRILGPAAGTDGLPVAGPDPVEGPGTFLPAGRRRVVRLLAELPASLRTETARGTIGPKGLGLVLSDGIAVHLGDATRLRAKAEAVAVLLDQAGRATIATIDVSVPGSAALTRSQVAKEGA